MKKLLYIVSALLIFASLTISAYAEEDVLIYNVSSDMSEDCAVGDLVTYTVKSYTEFDGFAVGTLYMKPSANLKYVSGELGSAVSQSDKVSLISAQYGDNAGAYGVAFRSSENIPISAGTLCEMTFQVTDLTETPAVDVYWYDAIDSSGNPISTAVSEKSYSFKGATVTTGAYSYVNYYVEISDTAELENLAVRFTSGDETTTVYGNTAVDGSAKVADGKTYYYFSYGIPAKKMGDTIKAEIINTDGNEIYACMEEYSVKTYYMNMLNKSASSEMMKDVSIAALNFSSALQEYFDYETDMPVNASLTEEQKSLSKAPEQAQDEWNVLTLSGSIDGLKVVGASLVFEADTKINVYFEIMDENGSALSDNAKNFTFQCAGKELAARYSDARGYWYVSIEGIAANELGDTQTLTIANDTQSIEFKYSPLTYVYRKYNSSDAKLKNVVRAMYIYYDAAYKYANR